jgi:[ribosomal protein S5]-alanine N-acetyltransferase
MSTDPLPRGTGRVVLRRLALADLARFQAYRRDPDVGAFQGWRPEPDHEAARFLEDMSDVDLFPRGAWVQLGIADQCTDELIGDVGICVSADGEKAEIGFTVAPRAQGSGRGTEAVREVISLIFDHTDVSRIVAVIDTRNIPAQRLVLRAGFQKVESLSTVFRGEPCTEDVWAISRADTITGAKRPRGIDDDFSSAG